jgi:vacuolar protein-sorting-associated protein 4
MVQKAIDHDVQQNYAEACKEYLNALDYFVLALKRKDESSRQDQPMTSWFTDETNSQLKILIRAKISDYLTRAETLKTHIAREGGKPARGAITMNGSVNSQE